MNLKQQFLREIIGLVQQNVFLFDTTIRDNILYGRLNASEMEVVAAAKQANIWDFIQSLPQGLDTPVGERGIKLSGGSEQNELTDNVVSDNDLEGFLIEGLSVGNTIEGNNITSNFGGIKFSASGQNIIADNNIESNSREGVLIETSNSNIIRNNNFIGNSRQAKYLFSSRNSWVENYWDNWIGLKLTNPIFQNFPKILVGRYFSIPIIPYIYYYFIITILKILTFNFPIIPRAYDWNPASEPYDIGV